MRALQMAIPSALEPTAFREDPNPGRFDPVKCQTCRDSTWINNPETRIATPCPDCRDAGSDDLLKDRLRAIGVLDEDIESAFREWDSKIESTVRDSALRTAQMWGTGVVPIATITLTGVTGSGKSMVSGQCLVAYLRAGGKSPMWIYVDEATQDFMGLDNTERRQLENRIYSAGVVVFDDAGAGREALSDIWTRWVRGRYQRGVPSITNTNAKDVDEFDARTASRLKAGVHGPVGTSDYRSK